MHLNSLLKNWKKKFHSQKDFITTFNEPIEPLYIPKCNCDNYEKKLGFPGAYPFTRGIYPTMYRGQFWTFRQYSGFGSAEESNSRYHYLLKQGQTGLSLAFDLPTQLGFDSNHPLAHAEVGKVGVAIDSLADMEVLFHNIPLERISTSMTINSTAAILLAMYSALAEKRGIPLNSLRGTVQNDILKEYIARGTHIYPPRQSLRLVTDIITFCAKHMPKWNPISISGYHIREAGANSVQELAFTFANAITYIEEVLKQGLKIDDFAPRLSFFFDVQNNLFEEVAKFRAARRIWSTLMKEHYGAKNPKSQMLRFHCQTAGSSLTAQQPLNNIVRVTIQALAAVLGGTQSLHTNSMEEALSLPNEESALLALRTQQIIAHESGVIDTIDPLGGSFYVENLTDKIETLVNQYLDKIKKLGGMVKAIEDRFPQTEIENSAFNYQKQIENKEKIVVGVNMYSDDILSKIKPLKPQASIRKIQLKRLKEIKKRRNNKKVILALKKIEEAAHGKTNLIPFIIEAVKEYSTVGEISDVLRSVFGEYKEFISS